MIKGLAVQSQMFGVAQCPDFTPDRYLQEGDEIRFADIKLSVLHCPGHTPGHIIFVNHADKLISMGDVLFQGSVGRTDFPQGDHATLIHSIKTKFCPSVMIINLFLAMEQCLIWLLSDNLIPSCKTSFIQIR